MPRRLVFLRNVDRNGPVGFDGGTMSKERELLQRALKLADHYIIGQEDLAEEIRAYLAEPEKKREPLSEEEIRRLFAGAQWSYEDECTFIDGIRFAEKHHGIGGENEPVGKTDKFIRLTEVEVLALMNRDINGYSLICAVENQLAEKNT